MADAVDLGEGPLAELPLHLVGVADHLPITKKWHQKVVRPLDCVSEAPGTGDRLRAVATTCIRSLSERGTEERESPICIGVLNREYVRTGSPEAAMTRWSV